MTPAAFGGFQLGQAVAAAQQTAPTDFVPHALQSTFTKPIDPYEAVIYRVERTPDSRTFCTRIVRAVQNDVVAFVAIVGLQNGTAKPRPGTAHRHKPAVPELNGVKPTDITLHAKERMKQLGVPQTIIDGAPEDPFDWRHVADVYGSPDDPSTYRCYSFLRSPPLASDSAAVHLAALAFMTDSWFLVLGNMANPKLTNNGLNLKQMATLNHSAHFHDSAVRADDWLVSEKMVTWADHGRVLVQHKAWDYKTGKLVVSAEQEGLVRLHAAKI